MTHGPLAHSLLKMQTWGWVVECHLQWVQRDLPTPVASSLPWGMCDLGLLGHCSRWPLRKGTVLLVLATGRGRPVGLPGPPWALSPTPISPADALCFFHLGVTSVHDATFLHMQLNTRSTPAWCEGAGRSSVPGVALLEAGWQACRPGPTHRGFHMGNGSPLAHSGKNQCRLSESVGCPVRT